jgi:flagellar biosynthesis/type III secretory pathway protein FliH
MTEERITDPRGEDPDELRAQAERWRAAASTAHDTSVALARRGAEDEALAREAAATDAAEQADQLLARARQLDEALARRRQEAAMAVRTRAGRQAEATRPTGPADGRDTGEELSR